jgi:hypothetical protein
MVSVPILVQQLTAATTSEELPGVVRPHDDVLTRPSVGLLGWGARA